MKNFETRLKGGHPNSLGNTIVVVEEVLNEPTHFDELFNCYFSEDEIVRLRVSNAMKRICKEKPSCLIPYIDRFITEISLIDQASTKWTIAQLFEYLDTDLSPQQYASAKSIIKRNLEIESDWIVLINSMQTLAKWSKKDEELAQWLMPHLERLSKDSRKSVSKQALKFAQHNSG
ncbi:hypothetical protein [Roseivirga misakiensis]|uniref:DNA alkylation repair protein n=1 Tax=Roseivirga misakiensis TaxID=1563681 RepID=A0A1E5T0P8_9BACT|nr:hypothetical protein [Roseivirga misakiensis]OEK04939.1 hypothetical protein BFP71_16010 [Roseivirga misakiensis]